MNGEIVVQVALVFKLQDGYQLFQVVFPLDDARVRFGIAQVGRTSMHFADVEPRAIAINAVRFIKALGRVINDRHDVQLEVALLGHGGIEYRRLDHRQAAQHGGLRLLHRGWHHRGRLSSITSAICVGAAVCRLRVGRPNK